MRATPAGAVAIMAAVAPAAADAATVANRCLTVKTPKGRTVAAKLFFKPTVHGRFGGAHRDQLRAQYNNTGH